MRVTLVDLRTVTMGQQFPGERQAAVVSYFEVDNCAFAKPCLLLVFADVAHRRKHKETDAEHHENHPAHVRPNQQRHR